MDLSPSPSVCVYVSVGRSGRKVYCGKMAEWSRMPFGMMSGVGHGMGVLDGGGYRRREMGSFWGEFGASHCNQWGLCCTVVWKRVKRSSCRLGW